MKNVNCNHTLIKLLNLVTISLLLIATINCSTTSNPESATKVFFEELYSFDFEAAKKISTDEGKEMVQKMNEYYTKLPDDELKSQMERFANSEIEIISVKETNNTAYVEYKVDQLDPKKIELKKIEGKWKVNFMIPILEKVKINMSQIFTDYNVYGQPDASFSKNAYPIIEFFWDGSFFDYKLANFYFRNIGGDGSCELFVNDVEQKQSFNLKANTSYILRIKPWSDQIYAGDFIELEINNILFEDKGNINEQKYLNFVLEEVPRMQKIDPKNLPDKKWFDNTYWIYKTDMHLSKKEYDLFLREDGLFGYSSNKPGVYKFQGKNDRWKVEDGILYLNWNDGYSIVEYELTSKEANYFLGEHSNSGGTYMLIRNTQ